MDRTPKKTNPQLLDRVIEVIQSALADNLPWLNFAFGKAERIKKDIDGRVYYLPTVYVGKNEYEEITPDDKTLGNYAFCTVAEPQYVDWVNGQNNRLRATINIIVWVDMRTVEPTDERNKELVKRDILRVLNGKVALKDGTFRINQIYENAERVFEGFTLDEIDNQSFMHPFCGWRFCGDMTIADYCENI